MTLSFYDDQSTLLLFSVPICLSTMFICGCSREKGLGGDLSMFIHTHTHVDMRTQINTHASKHTHKRTSKRVPGIVTFHISFKSMGDYSPLVRREKRGQKTLIESISFKHVKDHLRWTDGWIEGWVGSVGSV